MIKNNKLKMAVSSFIILLPMLAGLLLWNKLPEKMATHWGINGMADGYGGRTLTVFVLPLVLLALHWICMVITSFDRKNENQNKKAIGMVYWIIPALSLYVNAVIYLTAFGMEFRMEALTLIFIGLLFIVIGNYLPKCRQNYTLGIKVKWALENEENWNATHRMGGRLWVATGIFMLLCVFLPAMLLPFVLIIILLSAAVIPVIYSYVYHRKQLKAGTATVIPTDKYHKMHKIIALVLAIAVLIFVGVLMFTGDIEISYGDTSFTANASYYGDISVEYDDIESVEYRENDAGGVRTNGFGSARLLMGTFKNDEFGYYTRYSYTNCASCVVLSVDGKTLVLSGIDDTATKAIYEKLSSMQ